MSSLLLGLPLCVTTAVGFWDNEKVVEYDTLTVTGRLRDKRPFELSISREPFDQKKQARIKHWIGGDGDEPMHVTSGLKLSVAGTNVDIPRSQFEDLADPHIHFGPYLTQDDKAIFLYVDGSDAAGAYTARFTIRDGKVLKREIRDHESPKEGLQTKSASPRLTTACTAADGQLLVACESCARTMRFGCSWAVWPSCPSAR